MSDLAVKFIDPLCAEIEIDLRTRSLKEVIQRLLDHLPVSDLRIHPLPVEEVIKQIYTG